MVLRILVSLIVFALSAELVGVGWYAATTGQLFYARPAGEAEEIAQDAAARATDIAIHPYFGFAHVPNARFRDERTDLLVGTGWPASAAAALRTNNFGFISPYTYPVGRARSDQYFVGIFGGSVGMWFCQVGAPRLIERMKEHPFFQKRDIVPLCFSYSGYKQPQVALVLAYFLSIGQPLDLVVNIDGFNDVALGAVNQQRGADLSMPSIQHLGELITLVGASGLTPEKIELLAAIQRDRARLRELRRIMDVNRSAAVHLVLNAYSNHARARYFEDQARYDRMPATNGTAGLVRVNPPIAPREGGALFADAAALWTRSSVLMRDMAAARGATYVHFLQPNQYYTARQFGSAEAATALADASPYKASVEMGYPILQAAAQSLLDQKVFFFDATKVLDDEATPVYVDDCCHYTVRGNRVLADFIAASIVATPGPWTQ
jgi:hypothetical protein